MSKCVMCTCESESHEYSRFEDEHGSCEYCYLVGCDKDDNGECQCMKVYDHA